MVLDTVRRSERGQALAEYAIIVALVGACLVAILGLVGGAAKNAVNNTSTAVRQASAPAGGGSGSVPAIPASSPAEPDHSGDPDDPSDPDSTAAGVPAP